MLPEIIVFGQTINTFLILFLAGIIAGNWSFARNVRKRLKANELQLILIQAGLVLVFLLGGMMGSVVLYGTSVSAVGGYTIVGSIIVMALATPLVARAVGLSGRGRMLADLVSVAFIPTQAIGKLGCLLAGCCYGTPWESPLAITYPEGSPAPHGIHLHAVQLYEAVVLMGLWLICRRMLQKNYAAGVVTGVFLIGKGCERFLTEPLRGDTVMTETGISTAQLASLVCIVAGLIYILFRKRGATEMPAFSMQGPAHAPAHTQGLD